MGLQEIGRIHKILDITGEIGILKISLRLTQAGKIESQYTESLACQCPGDVSDCTQVLVAGKSMREEGIVMRVLVGW